MEEFKLYIETLKSIIDRHYWKEYVFYNDDGTWYSREHCRNLTPQELTDWVLKLTEPIEFDE